MLSKSAKNDMQKASKLRVVIDTNLLLSIIIAPNSIPDKVFQQWLKETYILLVSQPLLNELEDVVSKEKFNKEYSLVKEMGAEMLSTLKNGAEVVKVIPNNDLPVHSRDPEDDFLLGTALGGKADYLITGDKDLLILNTNPVLGELKIVSARQFLSTIIP